MTKIMKTMKIHLILHNRRQLGKINRSLEKGVIKMRLWLTAKNTSSKKKKEKARQNGIWTWIKMMILYEVLYLEIGVTIDLRHYKHNLQE